MGSVRHVKAVHADAQPYAVPFAFSFSRRFFCALLIRLFALVFCWSIFFCRSALTFIFAASFSLCCKHEHPQPHQFTSYQFATHATDGILLDCSCLLQASSVPLESSGTFGACVARTVR